MIKRAAAGTRGARHLQRRRRTINSIAVKKARLVVVLLALAIALLAYAEAQGSSAGEPGARGERTESADLSERRAVERAIGRTDVVPRLEKAMGGAFGGVWFDRSTARLHVGATSTSSHAVAGTVAVHAGMETNVVPTPVRFTHAELLAAQKRLNRKLEGRFTPVGEIKTSIAPSENAVEVELGSKLSDAERRTVEWAAARLNVDVSVSVVPSSELDLERQARCKIHVKSSAHCEPTIVSGVSIINENNALCTAGPVAVLKNPTTPETATEMYLLTAGHCIDPNMKGASGIGGGWTAFDKAGVPISLGFAQEFLNANTDVGVIKITSNVWAADSFTPIVPYVAQWSKTEESNPFEVAGQNVPVEGVEACYSGQSSGRNCGPTEGDNVSFELTKGVMLEGMGEVSGVPTELGDSGSPWYNTGFPLEVQGTTIAGQGDGAGIALFQRLDVSFEKLSTKLELLTTSNKVRHPLRFRSEGAPTVLTGKKHNGSDVVTVDAGTLTCSEVTYVGEGVKTEALEATVFPTYTGCKVFGLLSATVDTNGCGYRFKAFKKEGANMEGMVDLVCPEGKKIEVTAPGCRVTVGSQNNLSKVTYTNVGSGATREVTVDVNLSGLEYEEHEVAPLSSCANDTAPTGNGTYASAALVTGATGGGAHSGIWVE